MDGDLVPTVFLFVWFGLVGSLTSLSTQDRLYKRRHLRFKRPSAIGLSTPHELRARALKTLKKIPRSEGGSNQGPLALEASVLTTTPQKPLRFCFTSLLAHK